MSTKSFAELAEKPEVTTGELIATLKDYAEGGWAINSDVVIKIIKRTSPTTPEFAQILAHLKTGEHKQMSKCDTLKSKIGNSEEYKKVLQYIAEKIFDQPHG